MQKKHKLPHHRSTYVGLNEHRRVVWNDEYNRICITLAQLGFSVATIAKHTGLTQNQVIYRCRKRHLSVMDYRNGQSTRALTVLNRYQIHAQQKVG